MKTKLLNLGLILSSFLAYFEWGDGYHSFLIEMELEIFSKFIQDPISVLHPFTVIPFIGQVLLIITLFQKKPNRMLSLSGLAAISMLLLLVTFIGLLGMNFRIFLSTLPFLIFGTMTVMHHRVKPPAPPNNE